jgi:hypothetical protein
MTMQIARLLGQMKLYGIHPEQQMRVLAELNWRYKVGSYSTPIDTADRKAYDHWFVRNADWGLALTGEDFDRIKNMPMTWETEDLVNRYHQLIIEEYGEGIVARRKEKDDDAEE